MRGGAAPAVGPTPAEAGARGGPARVGWLGGSFDPPHEGHLHLARGAADALGLSRVLLVPAARPPHKPGGSLAPAADRLALLEIACRANPRLEPCDLELRREGPSYSVDTALALRARLAPDVELCLLLGADLLPDLASWHRVAELLALVTLCPVARPGLPVDAEALRRTLPEPARRALVLRPLALPLHEASSTAVREALRAGRPAPHLPPAVAEAIARLGLYGAASSDSSGRWRSTP